MNTTPPSTITARGRRHTPGFSLIELVLVMTIISVLAAIAVPRYAGAIARYRADAAARRVVADFEYAKQRARSTSTSVTVQFSVGTNCVVLQGVSGLNDPASEWSTALSEAPYHAILGTVSFTANEVVFDGYGYPDSGGSVVVKVGTESRTIVLDADTGKAVVQ